MGMSILTMTIIIDIGCISGNAVHPNAKGINIFHQNVPKYILDIRSGVFYEETYDQQCLTSSGLEDTLVSQIEQYDHHVLNISTDTPTDLFSLNNTDNKNEHEGYCRYVTLHDNS